MNNAVPTPSFDGLKALVLHRPHDTTRALERQFARTGVSAATVWPDLSSGEDPARFDLLLFDVEMGFDEQFPWAPGAAPMPTIALIGSEAPGRIAWAVRQGADAHMLKPIGSGGLYGAMMIATQTFARRRALDAEVAALRGRLSGRQVLAEATATLMVRHGEAAGVAYERLRHMAMAARLPLDDMAVRLVGQEGSDRRRTHGY